MINRGAGFSLLFLPRTGPMPILRHLNQTRPHWILLNVSLKSMQLVITTNPPVKPFILPKHVPSASQDLISLPRCRSLQEMRDLSKTHLGLDQHMDMVGHNHPFAQKIKFSLSLARNKSLSDQLSYSRIVQPKRPHFSAELLRKRTCQPPSHEQDHTRSRLRLPVRQLSTIKHKVPFNSPPETLKQNRRVGFSLPIRTPRRECAAG